MCSSFYVMGCAWVCHVFFGEKGEKRSKMPNFVLINPNLELRETVK